MAKLLTFKTQQPNTTYLQGVAGWVKGTPASELTTGATMVWNYGQLTKVGRIIKETAKTVTLEDIADNGNGKVYARTMKKDRIVARPAEEMQGN